jgi:hypothetical protein
MNDIYLAGVIGYLFVTVLFLIDSVIYVRQSYVNIYFRVWVIVALACLLWPIMLVVGLNDKFKK